MRIMGRGTCLHGVLLGQTQIPSINSSDRDLVTSDHLYIKRRSVHFNGKDSPAVVASIVMMTQQRQHIVVLSYRGGRARTF